MTAYNVTYDDSAAKLLYNTTQDVPSADVGSGDGASYIAFDGTNISSFLTNSNAKVINSIAALRNTSKTKYTKVFVTGYYASGDGGGGMYWYDNSDTTSTDNGGTIIVGSDGGRWKLKSTENVSVLQFGARADGSNDDILQVRASISAVGYAYIPGGHTCMVSQTITLDSGQSIYGDSNTPGGITKSELSLSSGSVGALISTSTGSGYIRVHDIVLTGPGESYHVAGLQAVHNSFSQYERLWIRGFYYGIEDDAVQANAYRDIVIHDVHFGVFWYFGYNQDFHQNCVYEKIYVSGISGTGFRLNGGSSSDALCEGNVFISCAADGPAEYGWYVEKVIDTKFVGSYTELFTLGGYYFLSCANISVDVLFSGAGSSNCTTSTIPLQVQDCYGCSFSNYSVRGDKVGGVDALFTTHIKFSGGDFSNILENYYRQDTTGTTLTVVDSGGLCVNKLKGSSPTEVVRGLTLSAGTPVSVSGQVTLGSTVSFTASSGSYAVPSSCAGFITIGVNGGFYKVPFYN